MPLPSLDHNSFFANTYNHPEPALIEFYSPHCSYCQRLDPILEDIQASFGDKRLYRVNIDEERDLASYYRIRSVPTTMLMNRGAAACTVLGCPTKAQILQMWDIAERHAQAASS